MLLLSHELDLNTFLKNIHQNWEYYREEKQGFERLLILLNIKLSAKLNKLNSVRSLWLWGEKNKPSGMSCSHWIQKNEKDKSLKRMSEKFQMFSDWYFRITFCFKWEIFFQLTPEILKFQLCFLISIKTKLTDGHTTSLQLSIRRLVVV